MKRASNKLFWLFLAILFIACSAEKHVGNSDDPWSVSSQFLYDKEINEVLNQTRASNSLTLLWFSDIHGDVTRLERIMEFVKFFGPYFNDILHSGDIVQRQFSDGMSFWNSISGTNKILNVIGNHDTASIINEQYCWTAKSALDCYNQYIAPYYKYWTGTVFPEDFSIIGKCYYYKDYPENGVRLIVLDSMVMNPSEPNYDSSQITWLESVLDEARKNNYSVLLCSHCSPKSTPIDCSFTSNRFDSSGSFGGGYGGDGPFVMAVDSYINAGGSFISWICGDTHKDYLGYVRKAKNTQPVIVTTCARCYSSPALTMLRVEESPSEDAFNILSIDTQRNTIKIKRVGASIDIDFKSHATVSYDYENHRIIDCR